MKSHVITFISAFMVAVNASALHTHYGWWGWSVGMVCGVFVICANFADGISRK